MRELLERETVRNLQQIYNLYRAPEMEAPPVKVEIVDVEKRRGISKYYLYVMVVTRSNGQTYTIRRRYRQFNDLLARLEERFLIEAGSISSKDRSLPTLPGEFPATMYRVVISMYSVWVAAGLIMCAMG